MVTAVADFQSSDDPSDASRIGAMLTRLVRQNLAAAPGLEVLTDQRMADLARTEGTSSTPGTPEQAASLAERAGADVVIVGRYARQDAGVVATAEILRSAESRTLGSVTVRGDGPENVFAMADSLGHQIRAILQEPAMTVDEKRALSDQLTTSVDAYRAYVRGLEGLLRDDTRAAADGFREATILDPAFALAHFRLSMALIWTGEFEEARHSLERALAFREKLTPELQLMLDAIVPYGLHDDTGTALPLLEQVLKRDPSHHDALYMLGEIYTHSAVRSDSAKAAQMYERLLGLDPGLSLVYEHMLSAYLRLGDFDTARQRLAGWNALAAPNLNQLEGTLALWEGRFDQAAANLDDRLIPEFLAGRQDSPSVAAVLAHSASEIADSLKSIGGTYRVLALDLRADILTASGRFRDAADLYRMAVDEPGAIAPEGFHTSIRAGARQRLAFLLELQGDRPAARHEVDAALALQPESYRCLFVSGLLALRDGDLTAAQARLNTLSDLAAKGLSPAAPMYRNTLEAEIVLAGGDAERACTEFDHVLASGRLMEDWYAHEDSIGPFVRDGLARAQLAAGHVEAAEKAWSGLAEGGLERLRQPILWVLSSYERGCLAVEIGQAQQGRELLTEFLDHWGDSDATLSQVIDARKLLAQVVGH
jgi:tetratricopeptide (TPR) repeat protein